MKHNLARAKANAPGAKAWGVLKANGYGHGLERAMRGLAEADGLALVEVDNAVRLRELGWKKPILLLEGFFDPADVQTMAGYNLQAAVHCDQQLAWLEAAQAELTARGIKLDLHLKMNSGMNRLGFMPDVFAAAHARLSAVSCVGSITMITHFANADDAEHPLLPIAEQVRRFEAGTAGLAGARSLSNSAGVLMHQQTLRNDWIRPGIMLYGGSPGGATAEAFGLQPAMTLSSEIIGVQHIVAGDVVGYGSRYQAEGPMRIGVVACGYADGYPAQRADGHAGAGGRRAHHAGGPGVDGHADGRPDGPAVGRRRQQGHAVGARHADRRCGDLGRHDRLRADVRAGAARAGGGRLMMGTTMTGTN